MAGKMMQRRPHSPGTKRLLRRAALFIFILLSCLVAGCAPEIPQDRNDWSAQKYLDSAMDLNQAGNDVAERDLLKEGSRRYPDNPWLHVKLAMVHRYLGEYRDASTQYADAIDAYRDRGNYDLGELLKQQKEVNDLYQDTASPQQKMYDNIFSEAVSAAISSIAILVILGVIRYCRKAMRKRKMGVLLRGALDKNDWLTISGVLVTYSAMEEFDLMYDSFNLLIGRYKPRELILKIMEHIRNPIHEQNVLSCFVSNFPMYKALVNKLEQERSQGAVEFDE